MFLFFYFLSIRNDNYMFNKSEFDVIKIQDKEYYSSEMNGNQIIKVSFPGYLKYVLEKKDNKFILIDKTVYLNRLKEYPILVDVSYENRFYNTNYEMLCISVIIGNIILINLIIFKYILPYYFYE